MQSSILGNGMWGPRLTRYDRAIFTLCIQGVEHSVQVLLETGTDKSEAGNQALTRCASMFRREFVLLYSASVRIVMSL
jgi:hypothetical protein